MPDNPPSSQDLIQRILSNQRVPLEDLVAFLAAADGKMKEEKKKENQPQPGEDISFF